MDEMKIIKTRKRGRETWKQEGRRKEKVIMIYLLFSLRRKAVALIK